MGERKEGAEDFHADREQVEAVQRGIPHGDTLDLLTPELNTSGGLPLAQRASLLAAVEGVEAGRYAGIIVGYLSRLGRRMDLLEVWERVEAAGGRIIAVMEGIDTSTPTGRHMRNMLLSQATMEREQHAERFENLRRWATEAGIWQRRQTPRGYDKGEDRRLTPNREADSVRHAFRARGAGRPMVGIASDLKMTPAGVRYLLRNRVYLGELRVGQHVNPNAHPPIVTREEFEAAQITHPRPARGLRDDGPALLAGIVRCGGCGHVMTRRRTASVVYACPVHHSGGRCEAPASVSCHLIDALIEPHGQRIMAQLEAQRTGLDVDALRNAAEDADAETAAFIAHTSARTAGYSEGLRVRENGAAAAWDTYRSALAQAGAITDGHTWESMDTARRNALLRGAGLVVVVRRAGGRGSRTPLEDRVWFGTHGDGPPVFGEVGAQDGRERTGSTV
jgi:site-specific DNA recombinase